MAGAMTAFLNDRLNADMRWQSLPLPFELWVDGMEVPVMEELGAGTEALHETDLDDPQGAPRRPGVARDVQQAVDNPFARRPGTATSTSPGSSTARTRRSIGRSFASVAADRGIDPLDSFLDLQAEFGNDLRWYTVVGNDRLKELECVVAHPDGAHRVLRRRRPPAEHGVLRLPAPPAAPGAATPRPRAGSS